MGTCPELPVAHERKPEKAQALPPLPGIPPFREMVLRTLPVPQICSCHSQWGGPQALTVRIRYMVVLECSKRVTLSRGQTCGMSLERGIRGISCGQG